MDHGNVVNEARFVWDLVCGLQEVVGELDFAALFLAVDAAVLVVGFVAGDELEKAFVCCLGDHAEGSMERLGAVLLTLRIEESADVRDVDFSLGGKSFRECLSGFLLFMLPLSADFLLFPLGFHRIFAELGELAVEVFVLVIDIRPVLTSEGGAGRRGGHCRC